MNYSFRSLAAPVWRMLPIKWQAVPMSGEGARLFGGRWNMKGWPALYLATDHTTAVAEYYRGLPRPGTLVPYQVNAAVIADLTNGDTGFEAVLTADWDEIAKRDGEVPPSWALAQELIAAGAEGALVPSVQNRGGVNLVLWRWHDASGDGEGASLALLDPEAALRVRDRK